MVNIRGKNTKNKLIKFRKIVNGIFSYGKILQNTSNIPWHISKWVKFIIKYINISPSFQIKKYKQYEVYKIYFLASKK